MEWLNNELDKNESYVFQTRAHKSIFLLAPLLILIGIILNKIYLYIGIAVLIFCLIKYYGLQYVITDKRMIIKKGFFDIQIKSISVNEICDVIIHQTIADKVFGSGSITIFIESRPKEKFKALSRPYDFRHALYSQLPTKQNN